MQNIVVLAPHQDDEILSSYLLLSSLLQEGAAVHVVFATNGDYEGADVSAIRNRESVVALKSIGIPEENLWFLGYADTGMPYPESFLLRLYHSGNPQAVLSSPNSGATYVAGGESYHCRQTGREAPYCRQSFKGDLAGVLEMLDPDLLILPSVHDCHGDHRAVGLFWKEIQAESPRLQPTVYAYLVHGGDDLIWPSRDTLHFDCPPCLPAPLWASRKQFQFSPELCGRKKEALETFVSQGPQAYDRYLLSFAKEEEFFLVE